ncbi:MAG TPA: outer-membrane lipoprotein carrier protein LolA [Longimicrobiales bacterium]|nr:outer-membrane lipoprotein carrier protein LolA [Longimicrobiales bacterium]
MRYSLAFALAAALALPACGGAPPPDRNTAPSTPAGATDADPTPQPSPDPEAPAAGPGLVEPASTGPGGMAAGDPVGGAPAGPPASRQQPADVDVSAPPAASQADDGADVLRGAAAAYARVRSLRADFVMNFDNPLLRQTTVSRGTIYQRQPDRIALRFSDPSGDVILSDGTFFWVYYPSVNAQQVIRAPAAAAGEAGVNLQAQFVGNPVERFRYELHGTESVAGRPASVLTLVPRQRAEYRSLKVWIDSRDSMVRRFEITEHNGNVRRFDLQNLQVNPAIADAVFEFSPPPGARIVDAG